MNNYVDLLFLLYKAFTIDMDLSEWAKENCALYRKMMPLQIQGQYYYRFYFGNEKDRMWFSLRWS